MKLNEWKIKGIGVVFRSSKKISEEDKFWCGFRHGVVSVNEECAVEDWLREESLVYFLKSRFKFYHKKRSYNEH